MVLFLTSSPSGPLDKPNYDKVLDESNGFIEQLKTRWKQDMKALLIAAYPNAYEDNDEQLDFFNTTFRNSGIPLSSFSFLDTRGSILKEELHAYDMIMLAGGHIATQNAYFKSIHLKELLQGYEGIVIGISAGSMNCSKRVYVQPEEPGESRDDFPRFIEGLDLCDLNIIPHYQMIKNYELDGRKLFDDVIFNDSYGEHFLVLEDGSYVIIENNKSIVYGKAYHLGNGSMHCICENNKSVRIQ